MSDVAQLTSPRQLLEGEVTDRCWRLQNFQFSASLVARSRYRLTFFLFSRDDADSISDGYHSVGHWCLCRRILCAGSPRSFRSYDLVVCVSYLLKILCPPSETCFQVLVNNSSTLFVNSNCIDLCEISFLYTIFHHACTDCLLWDQQSHASNYLLIGICRLSKLTAFERGRKRSMLVTEYPDFFPVFPSSVVS